MLCTLSTEFLTLVYIESATFDVELLETFGGQGPLKMSWLRVLDIPFHILASLLYRSTRHFLLGGTNMPPRAPRGATVAKTHGLPTRTITHSSDCGIHGAGPHGSYGETDGSWAEIAAFGSSAAAALELLGTRRMVAM